MMPTATTKTSAFDWDKVANRLVLIVGIGIGLNLLFTCYISDGFEWGQLLQFSAFWLTAAFVLAVFPWFCHAVEIKIWTSFFKKRFTFKECLRISVATDLGSAITPTMVGGGPIKMGMLVHGGLPIGKATAMLTLSALEDLLFFLVIIPLSFVFTDNIGMDTFSGLGRHPGQYFPKILMAVTLLILVLSLAVFILKKFSFWKNIGRKIQAGLREFRNALHLILKEGKLHLAGASAAIFLRWVCRFLILVCLAKGLGLQAGFTELFFSQWLIDLVMTVTPTPGAIGGAEGSFYFVFKSILPTSHIGVIMTLWRFFSYYMLLLLAALFLNVVKIKKRANIGVVQKLDDVETHVY